MASHVTGQSMAEMRDTLAVKDACKVVEIVRFVGQFRPTYDHLVLG